MTGVFVFGLGFSGQAFARRASAFSISGTTRSAQTAEALAELGLRALVFDGVRREDDVAQALREAKAFLVAAPPGDSGDPALRVFADDLLSAPRLRRVIYLSTVGVYGGAGGEWIDEGAPTQGASPRVRARLAAEAHWFDFGRAKKIPVDVLRLAGIYGPGRNPLVKLREGASRRIVKPGQAFNRIHVDDIAGVALKLIASDSPGGIWNVADCEPAPPQDVIVYAAALLGIEPPPEEPFATANLTPMQRSFYASNQRISTRKLQRELGYVWTYPTYREGLQACLAAGDGRS